LDTDSAAYLGAAHNLLHGRGLTTPFTLPVSHLSPHQAASFNGAVPLTHFPPLYPLALGGLGWLGMSLAVAARVLGVVLIGVNTALVGLLTRRLTSSRALAVAIMFVLLAGPVNGNALGIRVSWLRLHAMAISEPLFLTASLLALLELLRWLRTGRGGQLLAAATFGSLAFLCRYVGIAVVLTAAVTVLIWRGGPGERRLRAAGTVVGVGCIPGLLWALYGSVIKHGDSARSLASHVDPLGGQLWQVPEGWVVPAAWPVTLRSGAIAVVALLVAIVLADPRRWIGEREPRMLVGVRTLAVFVGIYAAVVVATHDFVDLSTPLDERIFAPVQPIFYILLLGSVWFLAIRGARIRVATTACVVLAMLVASSAVTSTWRLLSHGLPAEPPARAASQLVRRLPGKVFIATNAPARIFMDTRRASIEIPRKVSPTSGTKNTRFRGEVRDLGREVSMRDGVVVLFPTGFGMMNLADEQDLLRHTTLRVRQRLRDGTVILGPS